MEVVMGLQPEMPQTLVARLPVRDTTVNECVEQLVKYLRDTRIDVMELARELAHEPLAEEALDGGGEDHHAQPAQARRTEELVQHHRANDHLQRRRPEEVRVGCRLAELLRVDLRVRGGHAARKAVKGQAGGTHEWSRGYLDAV